MVRPTRFEITEEVCGTGVVLSIVGELDLSTAPGLSQRVEKVLSEEVALLTLDLSNLTFMDSSGLRLLIELNRRTEREGWTLALVPSRHESTNMLLRLTGADTALPFTA
jgi:anti-sigma B factor antagonist